MTDTLLFAEETAPSAPASDATPWKILVVDDEESVHQITRLVLRDVQFDDRPILLLEAHSAAEARAILEKEGEEIALALVDVVMEQDDSGLRLVETIRTELHNHITRLVLRTGQPGQAPEERVIQQYDINDYKDKTELTGIKLKTLVYSSLRSYRDITIIDKQQRALENVIRGISQVNQSSTLNQFASAVLDQMISLLNFEPDAIYCSTRHNRRHEKQFTVLAATGTLHKMVEGDCDGNLLHEYDDHTLPKELREIFSLALAKKCSLHIPGGYIAYHSSEADSESLLYIQHFREIDEGEKHLLEIFSADVIATYHTLLLKEEIQDTQKEMIYMLGEAVEKRSKETGAHVKRVAEISAVLGTLYGLPAEDVQSLKIASPLHDLGKIAIPDSILHRPGKLEGEDWEIMKSHAEVGANMLSMSDKPIFKMAALIAGNHHEKWDGSGYPKGLKEFEIPVAGRITALADVFDALNSERCYKERWPLDKTIELIKSERGKHFDPELVDLFMDNIDTFLDICRRYPD